MLIEPRVASFLLSFYIIFDSIVLNQVVGLNELHIGGIFPIGGKGGWQGGQACMPAAKMALADVNKQPNLLPGYQLTLHSNDSEVSVPFAKRKKLNWI